MGSCSSMADPVLAFQLPEIDLRLMETFIEYKITAMLLVCLTFNDENFWCIHLQTTLQFAWSASSLHDRRVSADSRESFVGVADLLDVDVALAVDERLGGRVAVGHRHHRRHVLEVVVVVDLHLRNTHHT